MAPTRTRSELVAQALANLGVLQAGQMPEDEDASAVDAHVDGIIARLEAKNIVGVLDDQNIPAELFSNIALLLSEDCGPEFGIPKSPQAVQLVEADLRATLMPRGTRQPQVTEYF